MVINNFERRSYNEKADIVLEGTDEFFEKIREIAAIARQYRETLREIAEIEGTDNNEDEIAEILQERASKGKAGAIRKDKA